MTTVAAVPELASFVAGGWRRDGRQASDTNPAHPSEVVAQYALADAETAAQALMPEAQKEHWAIYRAIRWRDPAAVERLVRTHIEHVAPTVRLSARDATSIRVS
jgi:DNA-binding GntR family transcriptional regulator